MPPPLEEIALGIYYLFLDYVSKFFIYMYFKVGRLPFMDDGIKCTAQLAPAYASIS